MPNMKDSGYNWIEKIPASWKIYRIKDGFTQKKSKAFQEDPIILSLARSGIKIRDISSNDGQLAASYYEYNPVAIDDMLLNPMDLISGANCNLSQVEGVISPAYINLRYKEGFNPNYYNYYFKLQYWSMAFFAHGKGVSFENRWTLNTETLMKYPIVVPSSEEQKKIAMFLDRKCTEIDSTSCDIEEQVKKLKEYKKSIITEVVTKGLNTDVEMKDSGIESIGKIPKEWKRTRLGYTLSVLTDYHANGSYETLNKHVTLLDEEDYALMIRTTDLERKNYDKSVIYIDEDAYNFLSKSKVFGNEVIINKIGSAGKVYFMPVLNRPVSLAMNQFLLRFNNLAYAKYIYYFLKSKYSEEQIALRVQGAVTLTITKDAVRSLPLLLPYIKEQKEIANYLDNKCEIIDGIIEEKNKQIETLEQYKRALIYEYVTGKKEVPDNE